MAGSAKGMDAVDAVARDTTVQDGSGTAAPGDQSRITSVTTVDRASEVGPR
ncbi:hypothetical protein [Olsenella profusa]|uniref:hypothetical protein n=1 Tax=Olsenella profusa TaxID=138595 RepID=UPI001E31C31C|nr:hypothetical protein [Olsenella profusa]